MMGQGHLLGEAGCQTLVIYMVALFGDVRMSWLIVNPKSIKHCWLFSVNIVTV